MDFTDAGELRVNIAGLPFPHLFFEFILSHSGWRFVDLVINVNYPTTITFAFSPPVGSCQLRSADGLGLH